MNFPYDTDSGLQNIEAYRDEQEQRLEDVIKSMYELSNKLRLAIDNAAFFELDKSADEIGRIIDSIRTYTNVLRDIQACYDSTL